MTTRMSSCSHFLKYDFSFKVFIDRFPWETMPLNILHRIYRFISITISLSLEDLGLVSGDNLCFGPNAVLLPFCQNNCKGDFIKINFQRCGSWEIVSISYNKNKFYIDSAIISANISRHVAWGSYSWFEEDVNLVHVWWDINYLSVIKTCETFIYDCVVQLFCMMEEPVTCTISFDKIIDI